MIRRLCRAFATLVIVVSLAGAWLYVAEPKSGTVQAQRPQAESPADKPPAPNIDGGTPAARKEVDDSIARVAGLDLQSALQSIRVDFEDMNMVYKGAMLDSNLGPMPSLLMVLSDRRVAKIYELLAALPPMQAGRFIEEEFRADLARARREMVGWFASRDQQHVPHIDKNHHILSAELFLCAQFCDLATVKNLYDEWNTVMGPVADEALASGSEADVQWGKMFCRPEPLLMINIYLLHLQKYGCLEESDVKGARRMGMPEPKRTIFSRWDAHTNQFDFTHKIRGVPVDEANSIATFQAVHVFQRIQADFEQQNFLVDYWRLIAESCEYRRQHLAD